LFGSSSHNYYTYFIKMKLLLETCTDATVHLNGVLLQSCGSSLESTPSTSGLLVQVWFHDTDTLDDAAYAGRAVINSTLWPSKSRKRPRPNSQNAKDIQCDVLFVFHRTTAHSCNNVDPANENNIKTTAQPTNSDNSHGDNGGNARNDGNDDAGNTTTTTGETTTSIESLAFRRLFREVVFRAQVTYSSDKPYRTKAVRGVVVQENHVISKTMDDIASTVIDTSDINVHHIPRSKKGSTFTLSSKQAKPKKKSSSSKVLARSTPLYLNEFIQQHSSSQSSPSSQTSQSSEHKEVNTLIPPTIERDHVHAVYDTIADHWDGTRYAPWPRVVEFIQSLEFGSLIADVGCGNGKYMQPTYIGRPVAVGRGMIGCDMSKNLIQICGQRSFNALVCDGLLLPYRDNSFDAAISIAVFHHISTKERRIRALSELARIVKVGGSILIYAWAQEQDDDSRRRFETQDVLVPWHLKKEKQSKEEEEYNGENEPKRARVEKKVQGNSDNSSGSSTDTTTTSSGRKSASSQKNAKETKPHKVYQRYCHVYREGDLEKIVQETKHLEVVRTYFDCSNWAIVCRKN
jgi:tRNA (uracil-5-)-methyltransferase TRM9